MTTFRRYTRRLMEAKLEQYRVALIQADMHGCDLCRWIEQDMDRGWLAEPIPHECGQWRGKDAT